EASTAGGASSMTATGSTTPRSSGLATAATSPAGGAWPQALVGTRLDAHTTAQATRLGGRLQRNAMERTEYPPYGTYEQAPHSGAAATSLAHAPVALTATQRRLFASRRHAERIASPERPRPREVAEPERRTHGALKL